MLDFIVMQMNRVNREKCYMYCGKKVPGLTYKEPRTPPPATPPPSPSCLIIPLVFHVLCIRWFIKARESIWECVFKVRRSTKMLFYMKLIFMIRSQLFCLTNWGKNGSVYIFIENGVGSSGSYLVTVYKFFVAILSPDLSVSVFFHRVLQGLT